MKKPAAFKRRALYLYKTSRAGLRHKITARCKNLQRAALSAYLLRLLVRWSAYILLSAMRLSDSCMKCLSLSSKLASLVGPLARGTLWR